MLSKAWQIEIYVQLNVSYKQIVSVGAWQLLGAGTLCFRKVRIFITVQFYAINIHLKYILAHVAVRLTLSLYCLILCYSERVNLCISRLLYHTLHQLSVNFLEARPFLCIPPPAAQHQVIVDSIRTAGRLWQVHLEA